MALPPWVVREHRVPQPALWPLSSDLAPGTSSWGTRSLSSGIRVLKGVSWFFCVFVRASVETRGAGSLGGGHGE